MKEKGFVEKELSPRQKRRKNGWMREDQNKEKPGEKILS